MEKPPNDPTGDTWIAALAFHRQGKLAEAEVQYWKVLLERCDDIVLLCNLGTALSGQGKHNQAISCYRRAIAVSPTDWRSHVNLGNTFKRMGKFDRAQACYNRAIAIDDKVAQFHYCLGDILRQKGKLEKAASSLRKALDLQPDYMDAFIALSAIEETMEDHDRATRTLLDGIALKPCYTEQCTGKPVAGALLFYGLGDCRFRLNENYQINLSGGHFLTSELLRIENFSKHHFHIIPDSTPLNELSLRDLPPHELIVNTIACPDRERHCLETLAHYLKETPHAPVINAPEHVLQTSRDNNYERLHGAEGITFAQTLRLPAGGTKRQDIVQSIQQSDLSFPIIMRRVGTQSAVSTRKIMAADEIPDYLETTQGEEFYAIQYIDCRFREKYFRKLRLFCIDGELYPVVCHIDTVWNVHGNNRKVLMKQNTWMQDEEKRFLEDFTAYIGPRNRARLESLHGIVKLDFYGIDFTIMDDNSILIFELNPAMRHSMAHAQALPYLTPYLNKISDAFAAMAVRKVAAQ